ncbi:class I SAM-dependent methyltransferase [Patescibacteria group bacterium]|nr:class I SAM-dependent methyltransferase [Patescibacteria group bacterium]
MKTKIQGKESVMDYYQDDEVASKYIEQRYSSLFGKLRNEIEIKVINSFLKYLNPKTTLDLATGTGRITKSLKNYGQGYALDTSGEMLEHAKKDINNWTLRKSDAFDTQFEDNFFDVVISTRFIWHFDKSNRIKLFAEIRRILKDNGHLIFDFPNANIKRFIRKKAKIGFKRIYTQSWTTAGIKEELFKNNFQIVSIKGILHNPKILRNMSDKSSSMVNFFKMKLANILSRKEAYNYVVLAIKTKES